MNDPYSTPDTSSSLRAETTSIGTPKPDNSIDIAPEDKHIADRILAMDPLRDVQTPHVVPEGWQAPPLRLTALPPERQRAVRDRLQRLRPADREAREAEFVADEVRSMLPKIRTMTGVGPDASEYHREQALLAREHTDLAREFDSLGAELSRVLRYDSNIDTSTGVAVPVPVYAVQGARAAAYVARQHDLLRQMNLLIKEDGSHGVEGERRRLQALARAVEAEKSRREQIEEAAEADKRADSMNREARINAKAESLARMRRNTGA